MTFFVKVSTTSPECVMLECLISTTTRCVLKKDIECKPDGVPHCGRGRHHIVIIVIHLPPPRPLPLLLPLLLSLYPTSVLFVLIVHVLNDFCEDVKYTLRHITEWSRCDLPQSSVHHDWNLSPILKYLFHCTSYHEKRPTSRHEVMSASSTVGGKYN